MGFLRNEKGRFIKGNPSFMKGKKHTNEAKRKMSKATTGTNNPMYGKHHSEEHKKKMSEILMGIKRKPISKKTRKKMSEVRMGEKNTNWKSGRAISDGYIFLLRPNHPRANNRGYVKRACLVAEKKLGRYLYPDEIPHHENEIKNDDRPENIKVMTDFEHRSFHSKNRGGQNVN